MDGFPPSKTQFALLILSYIINRDDGDNKMQKMLIIFGWLAVCVCMCVCRFGKRKADNILDFMVEKIHLSFRLKSKEYLQ